MLSYDRLKMAVIPAVHWTSEPFRTLPDSYDFKQQFEQLSRRSLLVLSYDRLKTPAVIPAVQQAKHPSHSYIIMNPVQQFEQFFLTIIPHSRKFVVTESPKAEN